MALPTYDTREGWRSPRTVAAPARGLDVGFSWEQELGQGSVDQDTWLVSFVDILMLLLTLFVLLLAYKNGLEQKTQPVETVAAAPVVEALADVPPTVPVEAPVERAAEPAVLMSAPPDPRLFAPPRKPMGQVAGMPGMFGLPAVLEMPPTPRTEPAVPVEDKPDTPAPDRSGNAVDTLLAELQDSTLQDRVEVTVLPDSVNLEISDSILFAPASAALTESGAQLLDELAGTLKTHPYTLSVEGHTDNVPIQTARYPSNWELSSARATEVTRRLIERGIAPQRVRAVGYADTHPRADNASVEGRARNRRVSLVLMEQR